VADWARYAAEAEARASAKARESEKEKDGEEENLALTVGCCAVRLVVKASCLYRR
jgi:hypothetical protein